MTVHTHWILTADERCAQLHLSHEIAESRWHVDRKRTLENKWEDYHEHQRPSALDGGPSRSSTRHFASGSSEKEEQEENRRFARDVRQWLDAAGKELGIQRLVVFAASRFLSALRHELAHWGDRAVFHEGELTRLSPSELAAHPTVVRSLEARVAAP